MLHVLLMWYQLALVARPLTMVWYKEECLVLVVLPTVLTDVWGNCESLF